jgi:cell division protein FtsQ
MGRQRRRRIAVAAVTVGFVAGVGGAGWKAMETGWLKQRLEIAELRMFWATAAPILAIDMEETRQRVESLGWIKSATIARRLPDTIYLQIEERQALALWQHKGRIVLIDREGAVIQRHKLDGFAALPLVVGEDAPANAAPLLDLLRTYPAVSGQVEAAVRVSGRRWNLRLRNGIDIRLPAEDVAAALDRLAEYQREHALFERDVIAVDLRVPDRLIVRVSGKAADRARAGGENT